MVEIANLTGLNIDKDFFKKAAEKTFAIIKNRKIKKISLVFVSESKIRQINKKYRKIDKPTDVLSFEGLNEIFISPDFVRKQAKFLDLPQKSELLRVFVHGILHLSGFDHRKAKEAARMKSLEEKIFKNIHGPSAR